MTGACAEAPVSEAPATGATPVTTAPAAVSPTTTRPTTTSPTTTTPITTSPTTTAASAPTLDTGDVSGFAIIVATLGDRSLLLARADTPTLRRRGLMGVTTLGDLDGMIFAWDESLPVSFWMKNTPMSLDIGFFDDDGALFEVLYMTPCTVDPCPTHPSRSPVRYALEAPPGFFDGVPRGESLIIGETVALP